MCEIVTTGAPDKYNYGYRITPMIITVLIIPLSLPTLFLTLFYSLSQWRWLLSITHLAPLRHWQHFSAEICLTLLLTLAVISLLSTVLTGLLVMLLNTKIPAAKR